MHNDREVNHLMPAVTHLKFAYFVYLYTELTHILNSDTVQEVSSGILMSMRD
jgi:hypothetical protein